MNEIDDDGNDTTTTSTTGSTTAIPDLYTKPLEVIYQDVCMAIINKPQGMTVMGGRPSLIRCDLLMSLMSTTCVTESEESLLSSSLFTTTTAISDKVLGKPRPVHRLDNLTGGLLVLAKTYHADQHLRTSFMNRYCQKRYRALLIGHLDFTTTSTTTLPPYTTLYNNNNQHSLGLPHPTKKCYHHQQQQQPDAIITADVDGKESKTLIRVVRYIDANNLQQDHQHHETETTGTTLTTTTSESPLVEIPVVSSSITKTTKTTTTTTTTTTNKKPIWYTMVDLWPVTGRRHQLRKHMKLIGHSIYGDTRYIASSILAERYHHHHHHRQQGQQQEVDQSVLIQRKSTETTQNPPATTPPAPSTSSSSPRKPPLCLWAMEITIPHPYTGIEMTFHIPNHDDPDWFHSILWQHR